MPLFRSAPAIHLACCLILAVTTLSCSVLIDTQTRQCRADADCARLGAGFTGAACQDSVCIVAASNGPRGCVEPTPSPGPTVTLSFGLAFTAPPPHPGPFQLRACASLDPDCTAPVAGPVTVAYGDLAAINVPVGFQGLLEVTNPAGLPALEFLGRPIEQDTHGYDLLVPTQATVDALLLVTQQPYDQNAGILVVKTRDCDRQPLAGVSVTNSQGGVGFYFQNMLPQKTLTATTTEGSAGFVNVPQGLASIAATLDGRPMTGNSAVSRPGWITYAEIFP